MTRQAVTIPAEIAKLEKAFDDARGENFAPEIYDRFIDEDPEKMDVDARLASLDQAYIANLRDILETRTDMMRFTLEFWQHVIGHAKPTQENTLFFSREIGSDVNLHRPLSTLNETDIHTLIVESDKLESLGTDRVAMDMMIAQDVMDLRQKLDEAIARRDSQNPMFDQADIPECDDLHNALVNLRANISETLRLLKNAYLERADILLERSFFTAAIESVSDTSGHDKETILQNSITAGQTAVKVSKILCTDYLDDYESFGQRLSQLGLTL